MRKNDVIESKLLKVDFSKLGCSSFKVSEEIKVSIQSNPNEIIFNISAAGWWTPVISTLRFTHTKAIEKSNLKLKFDSIRHANGSIKTTSGCTATVEESVFAYRNMAAAIETACVLSELFKKHKDRTEKDILKKNAEMIKEWEMAKEAALAQRKKS